jgi:hypothetical protein
MCWSLFYVVEGGTLNEA